MKAITVVFVVLVVWFGDTSSARAQILVPDIVLQPNSQRQPSDHAFRVIVGGGLTIGSNRPKGGKGEIEFDFRRVAAAYTLEKYGHTGSAHGQSSRLSAGYKFTYGHQVYFWGTWMKFADAKDLVKTEMSGFGAGIMARVPLSSHEQIKLELLGFPSMKLPDDRGKGILARLEFEQCIFRFGLCLRSGGEALMVDPNRKPSLYDVSDGRMYFSLHLRVW